MFSVQGCKARGRVSRRASFDAGVGAGAPASAPWMDGCEGDPGLASLGALPLNARTACAFLGRCPEAAGTFLSARLGCVIHPPRSGLARWAGRLRLAPPLFIASMACGRRRVDSCSSFKPPPGACIIYALMRCSFRFPAHKRCRAEGGGEGDEGLRPEREIARARTCVGNIAVASFFLFHRLFLLFSLWFALLPFSFGPPPVPLSARPRKRVRHASHTCLFFASYGLRPPLLAAGNPSIARVGRSARRRGPPVQGGSFSRCTGSVGKVAKAMVLSSVAVVLGQT